MPIRIYLDERSLTAENFLKFSHSTRGLSNTFLTTDGAPVHAKPLIAQLHS